VRAADRIRTSPGRTVAAVACAVLLGLAVWLTASPAPALAAHHPCPRAEFCLYFNDDANGGYYHFEHSDSNLDNDLYEGGDLGEIVGDTSRYVWNNGVEDERSDVIVYGLPGFKGAADCVRRGERGTLPRNWWNNIESYRWVTRDECASAGSLFHPGTPPPRPSCHPYEVIGARGSGESIRSGPYGMGGTVGPIAEVAVNQLGKRRARALSLRYPALPVEVMLKEGGIRAFDESILIGKRMMLAEVRRTLRNCPRTRLGLIGYSQGAAVVSQALREMPRRYRSSVREAVLVADPYSRGGQTDYALTLSPSTDEVVETRLGHGALGARPLPMPQSRLVDVCYAGDLVCDLNTGLPELVFEAMLAPIHTAYKECCVTHIQLTRVLGSALGSALKGKSR
jgi:hypothetical protein